MRACEKKVLAWLLAVIMLFTNVDYVNAAAVAEKTDETIELDASAAAASNDGSDIDSNDGNDSFVSGGDASTVLYSGELYCGITWEITAGGTLYISGEDELLLEDDKETPWLEYKDCIRKVVVDAKEVRITGGWFEGCSNLTDVDFSGFDTTYVRDMSDMFRGCSNLESLDLSEMSTSLARDTSGMFADCKKLKNLNLSGSYFNSVEHADEMFAGCSSLVELDLHGFYDMELESAENMFAGCTSLVRLSSMQDLQIPVALPVAMYDTEGNVYESLPRDMSYSKWLYAALYSGEKDGIRWVITVDDTLIIGGEDTSAEIVNSTIHPWHAYKDSFSKVVVSAKNVKSSAYWFDGCDNITEADLGNFEAVTDGDMRYMFRNCSSLTSFSGFRSEGANLSGLFEGCSSLSEVSFILTNPSVTDLSDMFKGCSSLYKMNFGVYTSGIVNMDSMFAGCSNLRQMDLSDWEIPNLKSAEDMFANCNQISRIKTFKNLGVSVALPATMYDAAGNVYTEFPKGLEEGIWLQTEGIHSGETNGLKWNITANGTLIISGSQASESAELVTVYPWHEYKDELTTVIIMTEDVFSTAYWFDGCDKISQVVFEEFSADAVTDMQCMFRGCSNLTDVENIDFWAGNATNFSGMFEGCSSLKKLAFRRFVTEDGEDFSNMFKDCSALTELDVRSFNFEDAKNLSGMFKGCSSLKTIDTDFLRCGRLVDVSGMFYGCKNVENISDLEKMDISRVVDMSYMFYGCEKLESLDLAEWDIPKVKNMDKMVSGCTGIREIRMPVNLQYDVELPRALYNIAGELCTGYFEKGLKTVEWMYAENPVVAGEFRITDILPQTYTGKQIKPEFKIYDGAKELVKNVDYSVSYKNNTKVSENSSKEPAIVIKGKGNYSEQRTINFEIEAKSVGDDDVIVEEIILPFNKNKVQLPSPKLTYNGKKLVKNKDYYIEYPDLDDYRDGDIPPYWLPGTHRIVVNGNGNFDGWKEVYFTITDKNIMKTAKIASIPNQPYKGIEIEPELKVTYKGKTLEKDVHYTASYENNVEQGKATVTITGIGDYVGTKTATFKIVGQSSIAKAKVVSDIEDKIYTGDALTQDIKVELDGKLLNPQTDYKVEYSKNINVGKAEIKIIGQGAYSGTIKKKFRIQAYDLKQDSRKALAGIPENLVVNYAKDGSKPELELTFDGMKLVAGKDYTISYTNNKKIASSEDDKAPTIKIKGKGNFKGTFSIPFSIKAKHLRDAENPISIEVYNPVHSDKPGKYKVKPVLTDVNGKKLVAGKDYEKIVYTLEDGTELDAKNVVDVGKTVTVTVTGKGGYTGTTFATYKIVPESFKAAKVTIEPQAYTGKEIILKERYITVELGGETLKYGRDYEIVENSYRNNVKKGTASVTLKGIGDYGDQKKVKFKINGREIPNWFPWITW